MNNNILVRKYFKGELEPGARSKDFRVDPPYILVFDGKRSYMKKNTDIVISHRAPNNVFYFYKLLWNVTPTYEALIEKESKGVDLQLIIPSQKEIKHKFEMDLGVIDVICLLGGTGVGEMIESSNFWFDLIEDKEAYLSSLNAKRYASLIENSTADLTGLHEDISGWILMMKLTGGHE